jgi:hypothetical protein
VKQAGLNGELAGPASLISQRSRFTLRGLGRIAACIRPARPALLRLLTRRSELAGRSEES